MEEATIKTIENICDDLDDYINSEDIPLPIPLPIPLHQLMN